MIIENDPVIDLMIQLANSLNERCEDTITFSSKERKIIEDWIQKIGEFVESQPESSESCIE